MMLKQILDALACGMRGLGRPAHPGFASASSFYFRAQCSRRAGGCTFAFFVVKIIIPMNTMAATILDGNKIATQIKAEVAEEVQKLSAAGIRPGLAVILAGHNPASEIYVRNKVKSCQQLG